MEYDLTGMQEALAKWNHDQRCPLPSMAIAHSFATCPMRENWLADAAQVLTAIQPAMLAAIVIPTRKDEDQRIAQRIVAELVCCDITERMSAEAAKGRWDDETHQYVMPQSWYDLKRSHDYHPICFYGGWAADIAKAGVGRRYWCSSGGEFELNEGGGFQTCCDNPEGHIFTAPELDDEENDD